MKIKSKEYGNILELKNISFKYGNEVVLDSINITFRKGEKTVILGHNGCGKSTLFLCCNRINTPFSGDIILHGKKVENDKKSIINLRKSVGIVFQNPSDQIVGSTVFEEISFGPMNLGMNKEECRARVNDSIKLLGLESYKKRFTNYLSGGEQKRVTIADILAMKPEIILFDEPMASLDMKTSKEVEIILNELANKNIGVVVSTHDINFAWRWADRIVLIHDKKIIKDSTPLELFEDIEIVEKAQLDEPIIYSISKKLGIKNPPRTIKDLEI